MFKTISQQDTRNLELAEIKAKEIGTQTDPVPVSVTRFKEIEPSSSIEPMQANGDIPKVICLGRRAHTFMKRVIYGVSHLTTTIELDSGTIKNSKGETLFCMSNVTGHERFQSMDKIYAKNTNVFLLFPNTEQELRDYLLYCARVKVTPGLMQADAPVIVILPPACNDLVKNIYESAKSICSFEVILLEASSDTPDGYINQSKWRNYLIDLIKNSVQSNVVDVIKAPEEKPGILSWVWSSPTTTLSNDDHLNKTTVTTQVKYK